MMYVVKLREDNYSENNISCSYAELVELHRQKYLCVCNGQQDVDQYLNMLRQGDVLAPRGFSPFIYVGVLDYDLVDMKNYFRFELLDESSDIQEYLKTITGSRPPARYQEGTSTYLSSENWWSGDWNDWWLELEPSLTDEQRRDVWKLINIDAILDVSLVELDETPEFKSNRNRDFEKRIAGNAADLVAWAVYSDWLQKENDPRGSYIALVLKALNGEYSDDIRIQLEKYDEDYRFQWVRDIIRVNPESAERLHDKARDVAVGNSLDGLYVFGFTIMIDEPDR